MKKDLLFFMLCFFGGVLEVFSQSSNFDFEIDNIQYKITSTENLTVEVVGSSFPREQSINLDIPSIACYGGGVFKVTSIGNFAFSGRNVRSLKLPNSLKVIREWAFSSNNDLYKDVVIPESCDSICNYAFSDVPISNVYIPAGVKFIGDGAFGGQWDGCPDNDDWCIESYPEKYIVNSSNKFYSSENGILFNKDKTELIECPWGYCQDIVIPNTVRKIRSGACHHLAQSVNVKVESLQQWLDIDFESRSANPFYLPDSYIPGDGILYVADKPLYTINIPEGLSEIKPYSFAGFRFAKEITIPSSVKKIGDYAFFDCDLPDRIILPSKIEYIGECAFNGYNYRRAEDNDYDRKREFFILSQNPPILGENVFLNTSTSHNWSFYIPYNTLSSYQSIDAWRNLKNLKELDFYIDDASPNFEQKKEYPFSRINYNRTFNNTKWQALYVPFAMNYEDWKDQFDVAYLNDVHQYDDDDNGTIDRTQLEVIRITQGGTKANMPYLIRAKEMGDKTISINNTVLKAATSNSINCSSTRTLYTFVGTYTGISGQEMYDNGYFGMGGGKLVNVESPSIDLKPFRWYLSVTDRNGQPYRSIKKIDIVEKGETTGIEQETETQQFFDIYDVNGRIVKKHANNLEGLQHGIYIVQGKKIIL